MQVTGPDLSIDLILAKVWLFAIEFAFNFWALNHLFVQQPTITNTLNLSMFSSVAKQLASTDSDPMPYVYVQPVHAREFHRHVILCQD